MKLFRHLMLGTAVLLSTSVFAQTAEEVVTKYTAAIGGLDNINKVSSMKISGKMKQAGMEFSFTMQLVTAKAARIDVSVQGMNIIQSYRERDTTGWSINPLDGTTTAKRMNEEEKKDMKQSLDILGELTKYKEKGSKIELIGKEEIEGVETFKLKLSKSTGDVEYYYIGTEDYLIIKTSSKQKYGDKEIESESWYSDYKDVNGVKIPHNNDQKVGGQVFMSMVYDKIEVNPTIDDTIFDMPK